MCKTVICFSAPSVNDRNAEKPVVKSFQSVLNGKSRPVMEDLKQKLCHSHFVGEVPKLLLIIPYWVKAHCGALDVKNQ